MPQLHLGRFLLAIIDLQIQNGSRRLSIKGCFSSPNVVYLSLPLLSPAQRRMLSGDLLSSILHFADKKQP
ncbi:hypothetical protein HRG84_03200 [Flavisolibacter sp. BT320]|nr:hypothetical protein [Flavisolibacter longurius]